MGEAVRFNAAGDMCLGFFKTVWESGVCRDLAPGARVLEIGCAEANWLQGMRDARPDLHLTGIDVRTHKRPAADRQIFGDVLSHNFEPQEFDAIIAVSMIEWAGISHYGDPSDPDGDLHTLQRARTWITPTGWLYFDVPWAPDDAGKLTPKGAPRNGRMRVYTDADVERVLDGQWRISHRRYFTNVGHPDGPYIAVVCDPI